MGEVKMRAPSSVTSLRFMKEAQHYALAASLDGHIGQWDLRTGREVVPTPLDDALLLIDDSSCADGVHTQSPGALGNCCSL